VLLTTPDQTRVIDSVLFKGQAPGIPMGRYPDGAPNFHELVSRTPGTNNTGLYIRDIVITEIMFNPITGNEKDEYIEIYNRGTTGEDLGGWRLAGGISYTLPVKTLGPSNYVVYVNGGNLFGNYTGSLKNSGDTVTLLAVAEQLIVAAPFEEKVHHELQQLALVPQ
jgi:hypothetical protein